jgi:DNA-binding CsgD family transcriptional regulator
MEARANPFSGEGPASDPASRRHLDDGAQGDPISQVLREIAQDVHGDALVAAWHESGVAPGHLAWHQKPLDGGVVAEMLAAACRFSQTGQQINWCASADPRHGIMVLRYPVESGVVTVTVRYRGGDRPSDFFANGQAVRRRSLLEPFLRLWVLQLRATSWATDLVCAIDRLDVATFHFDDQARLLFGNDAGRAMIATSNGLHQAGASLCGATLADTVALQSAIDDVIQAGRVIEGGGRECPVVALGRENRRPLLAVVAAIDPDREMKGGTAVVVYVIDPDQELQSRLQPVCKLYCLSPVETKLACLLADGASLADAAACISVREQTARSYLKQIFAKTHTTRQAELVGVLLKSAVLAVATPIRKAFMPASPPFEGERNSRTGADG